MGDQQGGPFRELEVLGFLITNHTFPRPDTIADISHFI